MIFCGVDGGQSSTRALLANEAGELLGTGRGGPLIHLSMAGGQEQFVAAIEEALHGARHAANLIDQPITAMVVGATGIFEDTIEVTKATSLLTSDSSTGKPLAEQINVCSDALIALYGSHAGAPGIMVIAGTGTIGYGMDSRGKLARAGGWGWPLGDAGSAYAIGRAGLRAALFAYDGLSEVTDLTERFAAHFQVSEMHDIKRIFFAPDFGAPGFAALAHIVSAAALAQDEVALRIVRENGAALANEAAAVATKLDFDESSISVAPIGGAFDHIHGLKGAFAQHLSLVSDARSGPLSMTEPRMPAVSGAVVMALHRAGRRLTPELLNRVEGWVLS